MDIIKLSLIGAEFTIGARLYYGEVFSGTLDGFVIAGAYNDGIDYNYSDKNGNKYSKTGNEVKVTAAGGASIAKTLKENQIAIWHVSYFESTDSYGAGVYTYTMPQQDSSSSNKIRGAGFYNDSNSFATYNSNNYNDSEAFSSVGIAKNMKGVWLAKNEYDAWKNSWMSLFWAFRGGSSGLVNLDLSGVYSEAPYTPPDPYNPGGESKPGGGEGTFDRTGDEIAVPGLPTLSAASTGFITVYNPSLSQLNNLASYMWSDLFDINTFKKIFADPMDVILGLSIVPVEVPNGGTVDVKVGNISTGVNMTKAASQFVHVSCGSLEIKEYWGAYLDYAPYTKAEIYLPYCGTHPIDVDEIMGKTVSVDYNVDILSGSCCAMIKCGGSVLYQFLGQCSQPIPVSGNNWTEFVANAVRAAASIGSMIATAGASAPASAAGSLAREVGQISRGASTAESLISMKPSIEKSGAMCGGGGMLGVQTPYITFNFPRQCLPKGQNTLIGYPSYITSTLGELSGYTIVDDIHLVIDSATNVEKEEIEALLKGGVIL